jgi:hypothetical protein
MRYNDMESRIVALEARIAADGKRHAEVRRRLDLVESTLEQIKASAELDEVARRLRVSGIWVPDSEANPAPAPKGETITAWSVGGMYCMGLDFGPWG